MATSTTTSRTLKVTIHVTEHDSGDRLGINEANDDGDDNLASASVTLPSPRRGGSGTATMVPEVADLEALGVFDAAGAVSFVRNEILVKLERVGTLPLPDGRGLWTVADATPVTVRSPRPGDEGA